MKLSVIVPCYNEARTVSRTIGALYSLREEFPGIEIIAVDDGSTDGTPGLLRALAGSIGIKVLEHGRNRGKGAAVRSGLTHATGGVAVIFDADLEYDPADVPALVRPIMQGRAQAVYGSRFMGTSGAEPTFVWKLHRLGNRALTVLSNRATGQGLTDMETACKAFRRPLIAPDEIEQDGFGVEPEITARLTARGVRIMEVPVSYRGRGYKEGKKIKWSDGLRAVWLILKYRRLCRSRGGEL